MTRDSDERHRLGCARAPVGRVGAAAALLLLALLAGAATGEPAPRALRFLRDGASVATLDLAALRARCGEARVTVDDPYYGRHKTYLACPLAAVLALGFGEPVAALADQTVVFRALDGYARPARGALLAEPGGWVAFADAERQRGEDPGWEPIDRRQVDPGPFYVVWTGAAQRDPHRYPWPYQLHEIELTRLDRLYPDTAPHGVPADAPARAGYALFLEQCIACHAINRQGGTVGPELNVPRSIVEYRPAEQIKAYVRNPLAFRYTSMPAHPGLDDADLDALIAYFTAMKDRKRDPGAAP